MRTRSHGWRWKESGGGLEDEGAAAAIREQGKGDGG
jgi:hypothetical protein